MLGCQRAPACSHASPPSIHKASCYLLEWPLPGQILTKLQEPLSLCALDRVAGSCTASPEQINLANTLGNDASDELL